MSRIVEKLQTCRLDPVTPCQYRDDIVSAIGKDAQIEAVSSTDSVEQLSSEDGIVFRGFEWESCDVLLISKDAAKEETVS